MPSAVLAFDPEDVLKQNGIDPATAEQAAGAAMKVAQGGSVGFQDVMPLLGLGLAATGIGAPAAAFITGAVGLAQGLAGLFSGGSPHADWRVGVVGFTGPKPYGPSDPRWQNFDAWVERSGGPGSFLVSGAFPWLPTIVRDEEQLGKDAAAKFQRAFFEALKKAYELRINGYKAPDAYSLLASMAAAWNKKHAPGDGFIVTPDKAGTWEQISWTSGSRDADTGDFISAAPTRAAQGWYIGALLNGDVDGLDHQPFRLNTGPELAPPKAPPKVVKLGGLGAALGKVQPEQRHKWGKAAGITLSALATAAGLAWAFLR